MKHTDLSLIPIFVAVMEERNLSKAAQRLGISQPAVSQSLKKLKVLYDDQLFTRSGNGVTPTTLAIDIYPALAQSLDTVTTTFPNSRNFNAKSVDKTFSIAAISVASYNVLPELSHLLQRDAPNVKMEVHPLYGADLEAELRFQKFDIILSAYPENYKHLRNAVILSENLVVLAAKEHPRIHDSISAEQFITEKHVVHAQWDSRTSYLEPMGVELLNQRETYWRAASILEMFPIVQGSDAIAVVPKSLAKKYANVFDCRIVEAPFQPDSVSMSMLWHPSRTNEPAHKWFRAMLLRAGERL
ncbi:LysR family transcriptional regulator [Shewanella sp. WXL01]|uniref:LysR family transcriptional regulator n=1 Tax=Shewanella sp. WXL01 TaxID=2709721 RepID=UPI0014384BB1|nr:LysR family transcriptional regulator [Shewanella sp. WXL01]NKF50904.1 LysR family transcriptional regulator [Shewanella sp. WXL01]